MKNRILWIDFIKGLAIISVVFLHIHNGYENYNFINSYTLKWITSFHMPIFFVCAGYFFSYKKINYSEKIKKKFKSLVIPYIIWGIILGFFIENIKYIIKMQFFELDEVICEIFTLRRSYLACWFLITLFGVYVLEYTISFMTKNRENIYLITIIHIILFSIGIIINSYLKEDYFKILHIFISSFFFFLGYIIKEKEIFKLNLLISILLIIGGCIFAFLNNRVRYSSLELGNVFLFIISSIMSIFGLFALVNNLYNKIENSKLQIFIEWFGKNSIIILITHLIYLYGIRFIEKLCNMPIHTFPLYISFTIIMVLEILTIKFTPNFIKKTLGKIER